MKQAAKKYLRSSFEIIPSILPVRGLQRGLLADGACLWGRSVLVLFAVACGGETADSLVLPASGPLQVGSPSAVMSVQSVGPSVANTAVVVVAASMGAPNAPSAPVTSFAQPGAAPSSGGGGGAASATVAVAVSSNLPASSVAISATAALPLGSGAADPLSQPSKCSSDKYWKKGNGETMRPGEACVTCHTKEGEGPRYAIAGTLFPTGHEPDDCNGTSLAAEIVITDVNGKEVRLTPNSVGNFFSQAQIKTPYTAKVVTKSGERRMFGPQTNGDCNSCHTQTGSSSAPGRIVLPLGL